MRELDGRRHSSPQLDHPQSESDSALLHRVRLRDEEALASLYERHSSLYTPLRYAQPRSRYDPTKTANQPDSRISAAVSGE
jgi:hypothetical protein